MKDEIVGQFEAEDVVGNRYTILEIQGYMDAGNFNDPNARLPGMRRLETSDGEEVIEVDGELCLWPRDKVIRKVGG